MKLMNINTLHSKFAVFHKDLLFETYGYHDI